MFVDRQQELQILEERYGSAQAELFVLYGRRRVGKTELLRAFCQGKRHVFFVADLGSEALLLAGFSRAGFTRALLDMAGRQSVVLITPADLLPG